MSEKRNEQNIELKIQGSYQSQKNELNSYFYNSTDNKIDKDNPYNTINNNNNNSKITNSNKINLNDYYNEKQIIPNVQEFSNMDTLYGNNYSQYYFNNHRLLSQKYKNPKKLGNLYTYLYFKGQPIIAIGLKNITLVLLYESILHISFILMMKFMIPGVYTYMKYMMIVFYLNCFLSHSFIFFINPGIPSPDHYMKIYTKTQKYLSLDYQERKNFLQCEICNIIVHSKDKVEHCEECDICVKNYDHHCYWTGKCIAKNNFWAFNTFAFGTVVYIMWYFITIFTWLVLKMNRHTQNKNRK